MLSRYDEDSRTNNRMPSGVDMTVGELQQMAARQQRQIEAQQQALVAKEQRLKYLKQRELQQQQLANEKERLRQLRETVETQEQKLKRLRALRDEVTERRNSGTSQMSELESIKALFNDKEKELAMAVTKVETLSQQLDSLQKADASVMTTNKAQAPIIIELEKLRNELRIRNELNEQQNNKLRQQRDSLGTRRQQVIDMDKRIEELQARLNKKRALQSERQRGDNEAGRSNVAAVAPFVDGSDNNNFLSRDTKYQTLPRGIKLHSVDNRQLDKYILEVNCREGRSQKEAIKKEAVSQAQDVKSVSSPTSSGSFTSHVMSQSGIRPGSNIGLFTARPFGSTYSAVSSGTPPQSSVNWPKTSTPITSASVTASPEKEIFITAAPVATNATVSMSKTYSPLTVTLPQGVTVQNAKTVSPVYQMATSRLQPPSHPQLAQDPPSPSMSPTTTPAHDPQVMPPVSWGPGSSPVVTDRLPAQPPSPGQFAVTNSTKVTLSDRLKSKVPLPSTFEDATDSGQTSTVAAIPTPAVTSEILPASNPKSKLRALIESTRPVSDSSLEPTKKSMSVSSALSVLMSSSSLSPSRGATGKPTYRYAPKSVIQNTYTRKLGSSALDNYRKNMSQLYRGFSVLGPGGNELPSPTTNDTKDASPIDTDIPTRSSPVAKVSPVNPQPSLVSTDELTAIGRRLEASPTIPCSPSRSPRVPAGNTSQQETAGEPYHEEEMPLEGSPPRISHMQRLCRRNSLIEATTSFSSLDPQQDEVAENPPAAPACVVRRRKGNLKNKDSVKSSRRVSFDPLALLLDASLEGELELVMTTAKQVTDPSASNDEGITALHNAICAGHYDIVRFLVEYGCDINAPDSDGWTPLHCAASCNNLAMVKFLVEHGACVFATTISDHETAAEKCEEDEDGYDGCSEYLYSIQEKLGVINRGIVYAVFDFVAQNPDELSFNCSDKLVVLRKGDDREKEWWWAQMGPREGYMPRNLVGLFPRVVPQFSGPSQDDDE